MENRLKKVRLLLKKQQIDAYLISSVATISYLTGYTNFSSEEREAFLYITQERAYILTDGRYKTAIRSAVLQFDLIELSSTNRLKDVLELLIEKNATQSLGIEQNNLTVSEYKLLESLIKTIHPALLHLLRIQKDTDEIRKIEKACEIADKGFSYILTQIKLGVTEKELAMKLAAYIREKEADLSFPSIVAFSPNAAIPHHQTSDLRLTTNDLILLDFGVKLDSYCSDMTRTIFFGKTNDEQKKIYNIVLEAQSKAIAYIENFYSSSEGANATESRSQNSSRLAKARSNNDLLALRVDQIARDYIISQGYPSIPHSLGHGIGLQVHESPTLSPNSQQELTEGMVFSIEPGIYLPEKFGVRIEDLFVIENDTLRQLTQSPRHLIEI